MKKAVVKKERKPRTSYKYKLTIKMNDKVFTANTNDLQTSIKSFEPKLPEYLKTKVVFHIKEGKRVCEKVVFLPKAKIMFRNPISLQMFVQKELYFK